MGHKLTLTALAFALLGLFALPKTSAAQTVWFGGNGNWNNASNWSNGLPAAGSSAAVDGGQATLQNYTTPLLDSLAICSMAATCPGTNPELIVNSSLMTNLLQSFGGLTINASGLITVKTGLMQSNPAYTLVNANGTFTDNGYYTQLGGTTTVNGLLTTTVMTAMGGIINTGSGGILNDSGTYTQSFGSVQNNINAGGQMNVSGLYSQSSGNTNVSGILNANANFTTTAGAVMTFNGGTLNIAGDYTQSTPANNSVFAGGKMNVSGNYAQSGGSTSVAGTLDVSQNYTSTGGTVLVNNGGLIDVANGNFTQSGGSMATINFGGEISVDAGDYDQTAGTSTIVDGFLNANNLNNSGLVSGDGSISAEVLDLGAVNPGDLGLGTLTILGDYTQTSSGFLDSDFQGTGPFDGDFLAVEGCASLSGTVDVTFDNGFVPSIGQIFPVMSFDACGGTGTFSSVVGNGLAPGERLIALYTPTGASVEVVGNATPEPSSFALGALALITLAVVRRNRRPATQR